MKKIIILYIITLGFLLFSQIFFIRSEEDIIKLEYYNDVVKKEMNTDYLLLVADIDSQESYELFIDTLGEYALKQKKDIIYYGNYSNDNNCTVSQRFLFVSNMRMLDYLNLENDKKIDFNSRMEERYYSSDISDAKRYNTLQLLNTTILDNRKEAIEFQPFYKMKNNSYYKVANQANFFIMGDSPVNEFDEFQQYLKNKNSVFSNKIQKFDWHVSDWQSNLDNEIMYMNIVIPITLLVLILFMTTYIMKQNQKTLIMRLHGLPTHYILNQLFLPLILRCLLAFPITILICYWINIGTPSVVTKVVDQDLLVLLIVFFVSIITVYFLMYIYIKFMSNLKYLKTKAKLSGIVKTNLVLKMLLTIMFISPCIEIIKLTYPDLKDIGIMLENQERLENMYIFENTLYNENKVLDKFFDHSYYVDFTSYQALLHGDFLEGAEEPFMSVNRKYLEQYEIEDIQGNVINLDKLKNGDLLIPEKYQFSSLEFIPKQDDTNKYIIKNGNVYLDYNPNSYVHAISDPVVIYADKYDASMNLSASYMFHPKTKEKKSDYYEKILEDLIPESGYRVTDNKSYYQYFIDSITQKILKLSSILIIYLSVYLGFVYQSTFIFLDDCKKLLAIQYIQGVSKKERYRKIYYNNLVVYVIPFLISILFLKQSFFDSLFYFISIILLELGVTWFMIHCFEKKQFVSILKGEDDYE